MLNFKIDEKKQFYFTALVIIFFGLIIPFTLYPELNFSNKVYCDTLGYLRYILGYGEVPEMDFWYFNDRISSLVIPTIFYKIFSFKLANYINYTFYYVTTGVSILFCFSQIFSKKTTIILIALWACSSIPVGALSTDYPGAKIDIFIYMALGFILKWHNKKTNNDLLYAGMLFSFAFYGNPKSILYISFIILYIFIGQSFWSSLKLILKKFAPGFIFGTLFLAFISYFFLDQKFLFFEDTLRNFNADIVHEAIYVKTRLGLYDLKFNSMLCLYLLLMTILTILNREKESLLLSKFSIFSLMTTGVYHLVGGSIFIYSSATWMFPIVFILFGESLEKLFKQNIVKAKAFYFVIFLIFLLAQQISFHNIFLQEYLYDFLGGNLFILLLFIIAVLYRYLLCAKWDTKYVLILIIFSVISALKPFHANSEYFYDPLLGRSMKEFQSEIYNEVIKLKKQLKTDKVQFFITQSDEEDPELQAGIGKCYAGCDVGVIHKQTYEERYITYYRTRYVLVSKNFKNLTQNLIKMHKLGKIKLIKSKLVFSDYFWVFKVER